jgi:hypothetical protein
MSGYYSNFPQGSHDRTRTDYVKADALIEPIGGPPRVQELMDRFPESAYAQGPDTHLYKFLEALCGDAGAGLLKKQTLIARLQGEAESISYKDLDKFYSSHFSFGRIRPEVYSFDTDIDALTPDEWADVQLKDSRYLHRAQKLMSATRYGSSPQGMAYAAEAGSGVESEVREHYPFLFDQYSDDRLGLEPYGKSSSVNEFIVMPRLGKPDGSFSTDYAFDAQSIRVASFWPPTHEATRPMTLEAVYATEQHVPRSSIEGVVARGWYFLLPDLHRNMLDIMDRLRPVGSLMSVMPQEYKHIEVDPSPVVDSSTERIFPTRFVNGRPDVNWPDPSSADANFIQSGVENQAISYADSQIQMPDVFHTIDSIISYSETALADPLYNTSAFTGLAASRYKSEHAGTFPAFVSNVYPILQSVEVDQIHAQENAIAPNTLPVFVGSWRS